MTNNLNELVEKVLKDLTTDHADDRDVRALCEFALGQHDAIDLLCAENLLLTSQVDDLTSELAIVAHQSNLVQYSEESSIF